MSLSDRAKTYSGGLTKLASKARLSRPSLYDAMSGKVHPSAGNSRENPEGFGFAAKALGRTQRATSGQFIPIDSEKETRVHANER